MDLTRLLPPDHVIINMTPTNREDALKQLIAPLNATGIITDPDEFYKDLETREEQITTVIGNGVALPHARTASATRLGLSVGLLPDGKTFKYSDEEDVEEINVVFMIAIPTFAPTSHFPLIQHLAKFCRYEKKLAKLLKSKTGNAATKYLNSFKSK